MKGTLQDLRDWGQRQPAIGRCAFCPDWQVEGTAQEIRVLNEQHRAQAHPDLQPRRGKRQRSQVSLLRWRSEIGEELHAEIQEERLKRMRLLGISE